MAKKREISAFMCMIYYIILSVSLIILKFANIIKTDWLMVLIPIYVPIVTIIIIILFLVFLRFLCND